MKTNEIKAPRRYQKWALASGSDEADRIFESLCKVLSDRRQEITWEDYSPADWLLLGKMAAAEEIAPIVYWKLKTRWPEGAPEGLRKGLQTAYYKNTSRNAWLFTELEYILKELDKAGVPVVALKGAALATTVYEDIALRKMSDIDLLVPQELCDKAVQAVGALGYAESVPEIGPGFNQKIGHHALLTKTGSPGMILEMHWTLIGGSEYSYSVPVDWFWTQTEPWMGFTGTATNAKTLNPTSNLLYLSAHAMLQHGASQVTLRSLYDIDRLIRLMGGRINWELAARQSQEFGWTPALIAALKMVEYAFNTPLREGFIQSLPSGGLFQSIVDAKQIPARTRYDLEGRDLSEVNWTTRWRLVAAILIPRPAYMRWRYKPQPELLWPITYFYRWIDIGRDILMTVLKKTWNNANK